MGPAMILLAIVLAQWLLGLLVLGRLLGRRAVAIAPRTPSRVADPAELSIIIPARNEERALPALLRSIAAQGVRPREVIVVDDSSTDRTADVARQFGATLILSRPLPQGWRGKTWACWQGARCAAGRLLLFVDADTWFEPGGLLALLGSRAEGVLSVGPYHAVRTACEQLSAFFNLLMTAGTGAFTVWGGRPQGLFGQMVLVEREDYWRVNGHEAVKGRILESFYLAERFAEHGVPLRCLVGKGVCAFRMYPDGLRQLLEGWTKGFASGAARTPRTVLLLIVAWLGGMVLCLSLPAVAGWSGAAVYLLYALQVHVLLGRIGTFRWYASLLFPLPLAFFFAVLAVSAVRAHRHVTWKGRTIHGD